MADHRVRSKADSFLPGIGRYLRQRHWTFFGLAGELLKDVGLKVIELEKPACQAKKKAPFLGLIILRMRIR